MTISQIQSLTPEERRVKCAEAIGWKWLQRVGQTPAWLFPPDAKAETRNGMQFFGGIVGEFGPIRENGYKWGFPHTSKAPDPDNSLDACAVLEATLTDKEWNDYERNLLVVTGAETREQGPINWRKAVSASPHHRTTAFLAVKL